MKEPVVTCGIFLFNIRINKILICHATHSRWNLWSVPKGLKDSNEDSFTTASRELKEETGIDISEIHIIARYTLPAVKYQKQNKIIESFLIITDSDLDNFPFSCSTMINHDFPEVDKWKWIKPDEIKTFLHESQQKNLDMIYELINLRCDKDHRRPDHAHGFGFTAVVYLYRLN